eukprot:1157016-Pelagomonas_calceolata.AAC.4
MHASWGQVLQCVVFPACSLHHAHITREDFAMRYSLSLLPALCMRYEGRLYNVSQSQPASCTMSALRVKTLRCVTVSACSLHHVCVTREDYCAKCFSLSLLPAPCLFNEGRHYDALQSQPTPCIMSA